MPATARPRGAGEGRRRSLVLDRGEPAVDLLFERAGGRLGEDLAINLLGVLAGALALEQAGLVEQGAVAEEVAGALGVLGQRAAGLDGLVDVAAGLVGVGQAFFGQEAKALVDLVDEAL